MKRLSFIILIIPIVFILGIYIPVFIWLVRNWISNPSYQHGFLIPIIFGVILGLRRKYLITSKPVPVGVVIFCVGLLIYALSFIFGIWYVSAVSLLIVITGFFLYYVKFQNAKKFFSAIVFLILMIPFPFISPISLYLQTATVHSSAAISGWFGVVFIIIGNQIQVGALNFVIGTTCSGINNLVALLTITAMICFLTNGSLLKKCIIIMSAVPVAIATNSIRVALVLIIAQHWGTGPAIDYFHFYSDIVIFIIATVLIILETRMLRCNFRSFQELKNG